MDKETLKIAVVQEDIKWLDKGTNLQTVRRICQETDADIIAFPETFLTGFSMDTSQAIEMTDPIIENLKGISKETNRALSLTIMIKEDGKIYNRGFFFMPDGTFEVQDKRHLFRFGGEHDNVSPARNRNIINYLGWNILITVCYDLRFPVWLRNKGNEYDLMINMANWPEPRNKVYTTLLMARAMENIAYVAGANRVGQDITGINHTGDSAIIDYKGKYAAKAEQNKKTVLIAEIDKESLMKFRKKFPAWMDQDKFDMEM